MPGKYKNDASGGSDYSQLYEYVTSEFKTVLEDQQVPAAACPFTAPPSDDPDSRLEAELIRLGIR